MVGRATDGSGSAPGGSGLADSAPGGRGSHGSSPAGRVSVGSAPGASGQGTARAGGAGGGAAGDADGLRAWCRICPAPEYPERAIRQGWQGTVDVSLRVAGDGSVEAASVGRSSGIALLDEAAVTVARRSRFSLPAGGEGLRGSLRYRFVLETAAAARHDL